MGQGRSERYTEIATEFVRLKVDVIVTSSEVTTFEIRRAEDIAPVFEGLKGRAEALYVCGDPLTNANRIRINTLALGARLPTMLSVSVEGGGLISYGVSFGPIPARR